MKNRLNHLADVFTTQRTHIAYFMGESNHKWRTGLDQFGFRFFSRTVRFPVPVLGSFSETARFPVPVFGSFLKTARFAVPVFGSNRNLNRNRFTALIMAAVFNDARNIAL